MVNVLLSMTTYVVQGKGNVFTGVPHMPTCGGGGADLPGHVSRGSAPLFYPKPGRYDTCPNSPISTPLLHTPPLWSGR